MKNKSFSKFISKNMFYINPVYTIFKPMNQTSIKKKYPLNNPVIIYFHIIVPSIICFAKQTPLTI